MMGFLFVYGLLVEYLAKAFAFVCGLSVVAFLLGRFSRR